MAQNPNADDDYEQYCNDPDQWLNILDDEPPPVPSAKPSCQVRLFSSQETPPPVAFTEPQRPKGPLLSPGALHMAAGEEIMVPTKVLDKGKKGRKRSKKSASQGPAPTVLQDGPAEKSRRVVHVAGTPMISDPMLSVATPHMRSVHYACLDIEKRRIREKDESYLVFKVNVPDVPGFVRDFPGEAFYLRHTDIFDMLQISRLHDTFVRLFSLNIAMQIIRDKTPDIAIVDPYYMRDAVLKTEFGVRRAVKYLKGFLQQYSDKPSILVPYHPESDSGRQHCVLIHMDVQECRTTYLDSGSKQAKKDYDTIKKVLDEALNAYVVAGGIIKRPNKKFGMYAFSHKLEFWCVKQPDDSVKDAFYALHHMKAMVQDCHNMTLPRDLQRWATDRQCIPGRSLDRSLRQDFFTITEEISDILHQQVMKTGGIFYGGAPPCNSEIDERLALQGDGRDFMMTAKGTRTGLIGVPKPTNMPRKKA
jgi:hypothetical protein